MGVASIVRLLRALIAMIIITLPSGSNHSQVVLFAE